MNSIEPTDFAALAKGLVFVSKLAAGLAKRVRDQEDHEAVAEVQSEVASMQEELSRLQNRDTSMQETIASLKQTIVDMENWEEEKQRYELQSVSSSSFVYALKKSHRDSDPAHWLCPQCFGDRRKSILHQRRSNFGPRHIDYADWNCNQCKLSLQTYYSVVPKFEPKD